MTTEQQYDNAIDICSEIFAKKLKDYGTSWRIMRSESVTDQIFIKASRIRSIEEKKVTKVDEGIYSELIAIVNYAVIGLIQHKIGYSDTTNMDIAEALDLYKQFLKEAKGLMMAKNHDYNEAWRLMRVQSYTDLILQKINRTKTIEDNNGQTLISEGIDANYFDMLNYAVFYIIKILEKDKNIL